ncbi:H-2 class I histocompatibility antigen, Q9 alpha chain-like isoform X2 [Gambusia affinis]|uniref:H-2 class I histocompatibility antigen, Q9 alpha chain-like isoform X2 n=1 Tax=Gambusia affinis TaxID=33528 RepID=UPI001CDC3874|nr:H-2 class I histocompatibility antigen, Q9 alpha chain-like isoform X2 [Gambusia affinis]
MKMNIFLLLLLLGAVICSTDAVTHSLKYFYTASSGIPNFPAYVSVGLVDDLQISHCDSFINRNEPRQNWMSRAEEEDPGYWEGQTQTCLGQQQSFKANIDIAKKRFNQTGGVHVVQRLYGVEWDDETGKITGFHQYGYDGEDFIALDFDTETWTAPTQQAVITKHKWDNDKPNTDYWINYHAHLAPDWLKKYVDYGKDSLMRTELPSVSLLRKSSSSPVSCHATGFYPNRAEMFWRKDGEEIHEGVDKGEILPNNDGTFQMSVDLKLSSENPEDQKKYECVFQLSGVKDDIITRLEKIKINIRTGHGSSEFPPEAVIGIVVTLVILVGIIAGALWWKRRNNGFEKANTSETSSSSSGDPKNVNSEQEKMMKTIS